jgi:glycerate 2-kinase
LNFINCCANHRDEYAAETFFSCQGPTLGDGAPEATKVNLLLPDVALQSLDAPSSGPTFPNLSTLVEVRELYDRYELAAKLPESVHSFFERTCVAEPPPNEDLPSTSSSNTEGEQAQRSGATPYPSGDDEAFRDSWFEILLSSHDLVENARVVAEKAGYFVVVDNSCDDWGYAQAAGYLLDQFHSLRRRHPRFCLISVGEVTVKLDESPGMGGRNQQFALLCALELDRQSRGAACCSKPK